jgi:hypothetical protein
VSCGHRLLAERRRLGRQGNLRGGLGWSGRLFDDDVDVLELHQLWPATARVEQQATYRVAIVVVARLLVHGLVAAGIVVGLLYVDLLVGGGLVAIEIVVGVVCHGCVEGKYCTVQILSIYDWRFPSLQPEETRRGLCGPCWRAASKHGRLCPSPVLAPPTTRPLETTWRALGARIR